MDCLLWAEPTWFHEKHPFLYFLIFVEATGWSSSHLHVRVEALYGATLGG